jgi:hypothetical protein
MSGENNFVAKAFCLLMDMDKMIGEKYDEGLASLKKIVEGEAPAAAQPAAPADAPVESPAADTAPAETKTPTE